MKPRTINTYRNLLTVLKTFNETELDAEINIFDADHGEQVSIFEVEISNAVNYCKEGDEDPKEWCEAMGFEDPKAPLIIIH